MAIISEDYIEHIKQQLSGDDLQQFLDSCQQPLRKSIRLTPATSDNSEQQLNDLIQSWHDAGYSLTPIPWCDYGFWLDDSNKPLPESLGNFVPHILGEFYIQEASSMLPVSALFDACPEPKSVLDVAAAPGSKTTQIALQLNQNDSSDSVVIANELSASRLKGLFANIQRFGLSNVCLTHADGQVFGDNFANTFDAILLDAPCGGEGTVRKDSHALENWSLDSVLSMAQLQKKLIISAYKALKPGGTLVYSTCTLSHEENQNVCQHLLDTYSKSVTVHPLDKLFDGAESVATAEGYLHVYPHIMDSEGFFVACFKKANVSESKQHNLQDQQNTQPSPAIPQLVNKFPFSKANPKVLASFTDYLQHFAWQFSDLELGNIWQRDNELWYFPTNIEQFIGRMRLHRIGIKLADIHKTNFRLHHQAAIAFHDKVSRNKVSLNSHNAKSYIQGKDIYLDETFDEQQKALLHKGEVLLMYRQRPLGLAKNLQTRLKNSMPRELVRDNPFTELDV